ncbi:TSUP family transporter [Paraburkholderia acidisoli]|uniref:Probable membrane transporter protein n=1 Tax=Paraburkholderia acidisoli TaxID=2571748 RepID=A0A7Z2JIQ3_9BURK|nr:TSUP family transporter [Paraburkholderia acidisoli]QGZ64599.1 TSUP family transporter [Paraburkholderia acidisoli]
MIYIIVVTCALVQSIFGIGLLAFGTPSLLLLGYSFEDALCILLPASLAVSLLQSIGEREAGLINIRPILIWALPFCAVALYLALQKNLTIHLELIVAALLLTSAAIRISKTLRTRLQEFMQRHEPAALILIGLVHGFSNMGGGLLAIYSSARYAEKNQVRRLIVDGYVAFATMQIGILIWQRSLGAVLDNIEFAGLAAVTYLICGRLFFRKITSRAYDVALSGFMVVYAVALICKYFDMFSASHVTRI